MGLTNDVYGEINNDIQGHGIIELISRFTNNIISN